MGLEQQGFELCPPPLIAAGGERAQRIAVIALTQRDDIPPVGFAFFDEILTREFQRCFGRFRSARDKIGPVEVPRRRRGEAVCESLGRF